MGAGGPGGVVKVTMGRATGAVSRDERGASDCAHVRGSAPETTGRGGVGLREEENAPGDILDGQPCRTKFSLVSLLMFPPIEPSCF